MARRLIPRNLQTRLLLTYLVLMLVGLGGVIAWSGSQLQAQTFEQAEHSLELESFLVANSLREPLMLLRTGSQDLAAVFDLIRKYATSTGSRITVTDAQLQTLASSDSSVALNVEENHPEFVAARSGTEQHDIRWDEWTNEERLFVGVPVQAEDGKIEGFIQLSIPTRVITAQVNQIWFSLLAAGAAMLALTAAVSVLLARQIARPIEQLTGITEAMAAGNLDHAVSPSGPEQVERLGVAFNLMAERVRETLSRQQEFVSHAAHELRSPLTGVRLRLDLLQTHFRADPALTERYLAESQRQIEEMQELIDHLLMLSALDEGEQLPRRRIDLARMLYELADGLAPLARHARLSLRLDVPEHLPAVEANPEQLQIAFRNLMDNAFKYSPAGSQVTITAAEAGGRVRVGIADTGEGIPPDALPHIFERFYRVDKSRSRRNGGSGLGLALVDSIVRSCGGTIQVQSEVERGTVFTVELPAAPGPVTPVPAAVLSIPSGSSDEELRH